MWEPNEAGKGCCNSYALRDIEAGEELFEDYSRFSEVTIPTNYKCLSEFGGRNGVKKYLKSTLKLISTSVLKSSNYKISRHVDFDTQIQIDRKNCQAESEYQIRRVSIFCDLYF